MDCVDKGYFAVSLTFTFFLGVDYV